VLGVKVLEAHRQITPDGVHGWKARILFFNRWEMSGSLLDGQTVWRCDTYIDRQTEKVWWDHGFGKGTESFGEETQQAFSSAIAHVPPEG